MFLHLEAQSPKKRRNPRRSVLNQLEVSRHDVTNLEQQQVTHQDTASGDNSDKSPEMASRYHTKKGRTSKRGAFVDGIWQCDCEPRQPADKFQTKNGGKNHGRWFYTCQKPQPKRCSFFLWADEAKVREESAVLRNSRSEPIAPPQTPRKQQPIVQPPTPDTRSKPAPPVFSPATPTSKQKSQISESTVDDTFDWSSSADEDLASALDTYETPRKTPRTAVLTSPGKRNHSAIAISQEDDVFATPSTSHKSTGTGLLSPTATPSRPPAFTTHNLATSSDTVCSQVLHLLQSHNVCLPTTTTTALTSLLSTFELQRAGIAKGREISRLAVQAKDRKIADLQSRIAGLEQERETMKTVVAHLKSDMVQGSPTKRGRRGGNDSGVVAGRRSEV